MTIRITIQDEFTHKLDQLGADAGKILDRILRVTGAKYRDFIRRGYLSGQMLGRRSGTLWRSVLAQKLRRSRHTVLVSGQPKLSNIYEHLGGALIKPRDGGVLKFEIDGKIVFTRKPIQLHRRPFMSDSSSSFPFGSTFETAAEKTFADEFQKRGIS
jgi:hypothetical protein